MLYRINNNNDDDDDDNNNNNNNNNNDDHLLINKMMLINSRSCLWNLHTAWIDYRKAFDSAPPTHTDIFYVLQMYKISTTIINFLTPSMKE